MKEKQRAEAAVAAAVPSTNAASGELLSSASATDEESVDDLDFIGNSNHACNSKHPRTILSAKVSTTLDCTNTSIRKSVMIVATVLNVSGTYTALVPSKSTIHCQRQQKRIEITHSIKLAYNASKSVVL